MDEHQKYFTNLGLRIFLGTLIIYGIHFLTGKLISICWPNLKMDATQTLLASVVPMYCLGIPILYFLVTRLPGKAPEQREFTAPRFLKAFAMAYSLIVATNLLGVGLGGILEKVFSQVSNATINEAQILAMNANPLATFIVMVCLAPVIEELVFRKMIVDRTLQYGEGTAVLVSGMVFGLFHGNLTQFCYAFALGAFLAYLYSRTGKIQITIGLHMIINFLGSTVAVGLMKLLPINLLSKAAREMDIAEILQITSEYKTQLRLLMCYELLVLAIVIVGIIIWIRSIKGFHFEAGEKIIEKGRYFLTVVLNPGMLLVIAFFVVVIVTTMIIG